LLTQALLPQGLIGLVLAGMFAHTMAMTSSDANAISSVVVRDILPALRKDRQRPSDPIQLLTGRICTLLFLSFSMCIALTADHFGGVMGLVILWYGALLGPIAIPLLFGMLNLFHRSGANAAIASWVAGAIAFALIKFVFPVQIARLPGDLTTTITVAGPVLSSLAVFIGVGLVWPAKKTAADRLLKLINDQDVSSDVHQAT
jgi:SSS family solute:Na+ symporter